MFLYTRSNGIYYLQFTNELGQVRRVSTRTNTKSLAFVRSFKLEELDRNARQQNVRLSPFMDQYEDFIQSTRTHQTRAVLMVALREFQKHTGDIPLRQVGIRDIETFLAKKLEGKNDYTTRFYYIALASAFETARRWSYLSSNPFREVEKPQVRELVPVFFTKPDFQKLIAAVDDQDYRELILCAVMTGMRFGELAVLAWSDIDFETKVIRVQNSDTFTTKNKRMRVIPMSDSVCGLLKERKEHSSTWLVFTRKGKPLAKDPASKIMKRYLREAGLNPKLHFHCLRHAFASWLFRFRAFRRL